MDTNIGKRQLIQDSIDPTRAAALHLALGLPGNVPETRDPLPPFWHQLYFWDPKPPAMLGRDGHPRPGEFIPDLGTRRRMWAGGNLKTIQPFRAGVRAERNSVVKNVVRKEGRSGSLAFVEIVHEIRQSDTVAVEVQNLVYIDADADSKGGQAARAPENETWSQDRTFDSTLLFRYSALTFNGHRIHYDADYCRDVEGYPGIVVHGPLLTTLLAGLALNVAEKLDDFRYRIISPVFCGERVSFCAREAEAGLALWVRGGDGRLCLDASTSPTGR